MMDVNEGLKTSLKKKNKDPKKNNGTFVCSTSFNPQNHHKFGSSLISKYVIFFYS